MSRRHDPERIPQTNEAGTRARALDELGLTPTLVDDLLAKWADIAAERGVRPGDGRYWTEAWEFLREQDQR